MEECERCRKIMERLHEVEGNFRESEYHWLICKRPKSRPIGKNTATLDGVIRKLIARSEEIVPNGTPLPEGDGHVVVDNQKPTIKED